MCKKVFGLFVVLVVLISALGISTAFAATEDTVVTEDKNDAYGIFVGAYGDSDGNNKINIKDATNVQKYVAGIISLSQRYIAVSNVDGNKDVNVRDATAIQKYLAGISVTSDIGSYLYITGDHTHNYVLGAVVPDCESDVYEVYSCICGDEYQGNVIPAISHNYVKTVVAPTCTSDGYTSYKCSNCLRTYKDNYVKSSGHKYTDKVVPATCTAQGYTEHTCSVCNDSYKDTYTSGGKHNYTSKVVAPTCTAQGYTQYTCSLCNDSYKGDYKDAIAHDYSKMITIPDCTVDGYALYTCKVCSHSYMETIPATGEHSYNSSGKCTVCGATKPVVNSKVTAFDSVASWLKRNGKLTEDGESYIFYDSSIALDPDTRVALFYNFYDDTIEIFWTDEDPNWSAWVTITRGWNYADYVLMCDDYLTVSGSFAMSTITTETSYLNYDYIYNPYAISAMSVKESCATSVKYALTLYEKYDFYYDIPMSLYDLGFKNY